MSVEQDYLRRWLEIARSMDLLAVDTANLLSGGGMPPPPPPPGGPETVLVTDHLRWDIGSPTRGKLDSIDFTLEFSPGEIRGSHALLGFEVGDPSWRGWSNYSANRKLYVETASLSTPKSQRVALRLNQDWNTVRMRYTGVLISCEVNGHAPALVEAPPLSFVNGRVVAFFGSSVATEAAVPSHKANIGWRARNAQITFSINGVEESHVLL